MSNKQLVDDLRATAHNLLSMPLGVTPSVQSIVDIAAIMRAAAEALESTPNR